MHYLGTAECLSAVDTSRRPPPLAGYCCDGCQPGMSDLGALTAWGSNRRPPMALLGSRNAMGDFLANVPAPQKVGSRYVGLSDLGATAATDFTQGAFSSQNLLKTGITLGTASAAGAAAGTGIMPGVGTVVGAAIGLIVGGIAGLFKKKQQSPPTTAAEIAQATTFINQYKAIAGTVIGRQLATSAMQDVAMALCINADAHYGNAGGCGNQAGISNWWNENNVRAQAFFTALANTPVGATVTLRDIASLPGHGKTNMNVSYTFTNPGVGAPSATLGPLFAQYFYTMCQIFNPAPNCGNLHLLAPAPQFYTDFLDWYRSTRPAFDVAGTVVQSARGGASLAPGATSITPAAAVVSGGMVPAVAAPAVNPNAPTAGQVALYDRLTAGGKYPGIPAGFMPDAVNFPGYVWHQATDNYCNPSPPAGKQLCYAGTQIMVRDPSQPYAPWPGMPPGFMPPAGWEWNPATGKYCNWFGQCADPAAILSPDPTYQAASVSIGPQVSPSLTAGSATPPPVIAPPPPSTLTTPTGQTVDVNAMLQQLLAQGQTQQQAYQSALAQLQAQGVQATPAVQQQVATAATDQAPIPVQAAGMSPIEIGLLALAAFGVLGAMKGGKKSARRRRPRSALRI